MSKNLFVNSPSWRTNRVVAAVLVVGLTGGLGGCGSGGDSIAMPASDSSQTLPTTAPATDRPSDPESPSPLAADTIGAVKHHGTDIEILDSAGASPKVSQDRAIEIAANEFGFINWRKPTEASLGRVTNHVYGKAVPSASEAPRVEPLISERVAWVLIFDHVMIPTSGAAQGMELPAEPDAEADDGVAFMVLIDATSGEYLRAESVFREDAQKPPYASKVVPTEESSGGN